MGGGEGREAKGVMCGCGSGVCEDGEGRWLVIWRFRRGAGDYGEIRWLVMWRFGRGAGDYGRLRWPVMWSFRRGSGDYGRLRWSRLRKRRSYLGTVGNHLGDRTLYRPDCEHLCTRRQRDIDRRPFLLLGRHQCHHGDSGTGTQRTATARGRHTINQIDVLATVARVNAFANRSRLGEMQSSGPGPRH